MLQALRLLLPALIPSWNFFDVIAASPRVEYAWLASPGDATGEWREFRPRPDRVSVPAMLGRLLWNARWNESLFVTACAERLLDEPTTHSEDEIFRRIAADLADGGGADGQPWLGFRIVSLSDEAGAIVRQVAYVAEPRRFAGLDVR